MGCRNVSKLYLPVGYNLDKLFNSFYEYKNVINHSKYSNNYNYNRTIYLMNKKKILDNGFLLLKKDSLISSPIGVLHYEFYNNVNRLKVDLEAQKRNIQCIVSNMPIFLTRIYFGEAQYPKINEYADNIDTMNFLLSL